jgi:hypothetical protein
MILPHFTAYFRYIFAPFPILFSPITDIFFQKFFGLRNGLYRVYEDEKQPEKCILPPLATYGFVGGFFLCPFYLKFI